jgi:hypothetical protein
VQVLPAHPEQELADDLAREVHPDAPEGCDRGSTVIEVLALD